MELEVLKHPLLKYRTPVPVQKALVGAIWDLPGSPDYHKTDLSTYFEYYSDRILRLIIDREDNFFIKTHLDLVPIVRHILSGATRDEARQDISRRFGAINASTKDMDHVIDLCASLLVMGEVQLEESHNGLSGRTPIHWKENSLQGALAEHFIPQTTLHADKPKLGRLFTARNLGCISGIKIKWTTNLADHLRLIDDDQAVFIFHCAGFLRFQNRLDSSLLPASLIRETLNTLALLFPAGDRETERWLRIDGGADPRLGQCEPLRTHERRLEKFVVWHDRLVILKQVFDDSQPKTLSQWWFDRRSGVQWYTFWIALLVFAMTIFFGTVQSVEGAFQVYYSKKGLEQRP